MLWCRTHDQRAGDDGSRRQALPTRRRSRLCPSGSRATPSSWRRSDADDADDAAGVAADVVVDGDSCRCCTEVRSACACRSSAAASAP